MVLDTRYPRRVHLVTTQSLSYTELPGGDAPAGLPAEAEILGRMARENFKVASRLLPARLRSNLIAYYRYARMVDFLGDEYEGDRGAALDWFDAQTRRALSGETAGVHPVVAEAAESTTSLGLDPSVLLDLVSANRLDQSRPEYATFSELLEYCRLSANPVGRFVLGAFGCDDDERRGWSDCICTGLQLAEHWQDVAEDARAGRIYLPREDLQRFGVAAADLLRRPASPHWRAMMVFEVARARRLLDEGRPLIASLPGVRRWAMAGFWAGGHAALDAIARTDFDVSGGAPRPDPLRVTRRMVKAGSKGAGDGR
jgi:squalene synthase HpnC